MSTDRKRRIAARLRLALARFARVTVALVTLLGMLRAGASYVYCPMMEQISDAPCCAADREEPSETADSELRTPDCCEHHVLAKLPPSGSIGKATPSVAAPFVAMLPAPAEALVERRSVTRGRFEHEGRAGPIARSRHRSELMVFLN